MLRLVTKGWSKKIRGTSSEQVTIWILGLQWRLQMLAVLESERYTILTLLTVHFLPKDRVEQRIQNVRRAGEIR